MMLTLELDDWTLRAGPWLVSRVLARNHLPQVGHTVCCGRRRCGCGLAKRRARSPFQLPGLGCSTTSQTDPPPRLHPFLCQLTTMALKTETVPLSQKVGCTAEAVAQYGTSVHLSWVARDWAGLACYLGSQSAGTLSCNPALDSALLKECIVSANKNKPRESILSRKTLPCLSDWGRRSLGKPSRRVPLNRFAWPPLPLPPPPKKTSFFALAHRRWAFGEAIIWHVQSHWQGLWNSKVNMSHVQQRSSN